MRSGGGCGCPESALESSASPIRRRRPLGLGKEKGTDRRTSRLIPSGLVPHLPAPSLGPASAAPHLLRRPAAAAALRPSSREGRALRPAPSRPAPSPLPLGCRARLTPAARTGQRRRQLRSFRSRSVVAEEAATGARPPGAGGGCR